MSILKLLKNLLRKILPQPAFEPGISCFAGAGVFPIRQSTVVNGRLEFAQQLLENPGSNHNLTLCEIPSSVTDKIRLFKANNLMKV